MVVIVRKYDPDSGEEEETRLASSADKVVGVVIGYDRRSVDHEPDLVVGVFGTDGTYVGGGVHRYPARTHSVRVER
jgi:hypothetical protein